MLAGAASQGRLLGNGVARSFEANGTPPCLLALHGFTGSPSEVMPVLERAKEAGFAVRAPLLPGHGTLPSELQNRTFSDWVSAAREHFRACQAEHGQVVVLGFSLGSLVAMQLATEAPAGLAGLVVMGNALFLSVYSDLPLGLFSRLKRAPDAYLVKPRVADLEDRTLASAIVTYDRHPLRAAKEVYRAGIALRDRVSLVRCPTLVLHGRKDRVCPHTNARWLADHLTRAESVTLRVYPRSAHVLACDFDRDEVAAEVVAFLGARRDARAQTPVEP